MGLQILLAMIIVPVSLGFSKPSEPINARQSYEQALSQERRPYKFGNKAELYAHIEHVAKLYNLPSKLLKQIVAVESANCRYRVNKVSNDYGCFQLNKLTIAGYKWNANTVTHNDRLNTVAAAVILSDMRIIALKTLGPKWPCSYNIGHRSLPKACAVYLHKLALVSL